jgi:hypothetical protein
MIFCRDIVKPGVLQEAPLIFFGNRQNLVWQIAAEGRVRANSHNKRTR